MDLRAGILGCSSIAPLSFIGPSQAVPGVRILGVAARDRSRAESYASQHAIPQVFASYDDLLASPDVDFIYIALPPIFQGQWVERCLVAGKHVLVEKPMCLDHEYSAYLAELADRKGLHLLEAVMVQHHPWQDRLKQMVDREELGPLRQSHTRICPELGDLAPNNFRRFPELGGGVLYDEAPYWLQFVGKLKGLGPSSLEGRSSFSGPNGLDWTFYATLRFPDDCLFTAFLSYEHARESSHVLIFERATVEIKNFFRPAFGSYKFRINVQYADGTRDKILLPPQNYYENQVRFFAAALRGQGERLSPNGTTERIELTNRIMADAKAFAEPIRNPLY